MGASEGKRPVQCLIGSSSPS
uniref:Uncharacterized protein n=1 Tax=Anguilla anguilla TaxID=7936 RepID=A0A0E9W089_ANGAN